MQFLAALALTLAPLPALAAPEPATPPAGHYAFQSSFTVDQKIHFQVVYAFTDAGRTELEKLVKRGDECWNKGNATYLCKSFQAVNGADALIRSRVEARLSGQELTLGELRGEPSLISKGDGVSEYAVAQPASYAGKSYESYRLVNVQGFWSIRLGDFGASDAVQFDLDAAGRVLMPLGVSVTDSRTEFSIYSVMAEFRRM